VRFPDLPGGHVLLTIQLGGFVNDVFPALAFGVGEGSEDITINPPRDPHESVLRGRDWWAIFGYGGLIMAPVIAAYWAAVVFLESDGEQAVTFLACSRNAASSMFGTAPCVSSSMEVILYPSPA